MDVGIKVGRSVGIDCGVHIGSNLNQKNLFVNGDFAENTDNWVGNNANVSLIWQEGGTAKFENIVDYAYMRINPSLILEAGDYKTTFDILQLSDDNRIHIGCGTYGNIISGIGSKTQIYTHSGGTLTWQIRPTYSGLMTCVIDNIKLFKI